MRCRCGGAGTVLAVWRRLWLYAGLVNLSVENGRVVLERGHGSAAFQRYGGGGTVLLMLLVLLCRRWCAAGDIAGYRSIAADLKSTHPSTR